MVSDEPVPPRLLIVDPRAILHLEYAACTVAVGFDVEQADNTDQGLAKAMLLAPDIVLTDCSADTGGAGVEFAGVSRREWRPAGFRCWGLSARATG